MNIRERIMDILQDDYYEENSDVIEVDKFVSSLDTIVENGLGYKAFDYFSYYDMYDTEIKAASKIMLKMNPKLKTRRYDYGKNSNLRISGLDYSQDLIKAIKKTLSPGLHCAIKEGKKGETVFVLYIKYAKDRDGDYTSPCFYFYIIGKEFKKYRKMYLDECEKIEAMIEKAIPDRIYQADGTISETSFKDFKYFIMDDKEKIIKYVDNWIENIPTYYKYGIIPKLSILIYGEPGTGKSTFAQSLAKHLKIKKISLKSSRDFDPTDEGKRSNFNSGNHCAPIIHVIDDIDCITGTRETNKSKDNVILQSLLSFLDNPPTFEYLHKDGNMYKISIVVSTTNYYDKLDPAVKRYGRFDYQFEMPSFMEKQAEEMCQLYNLHLKDIYLEKYDKNTKFNPAFIQALCIMNIDSNLKGDD